jgi:hypothetical protein
MGLIGLNEQALPFVNMNGWADAAYDEAIHSCLCKLVPERQQAQRLHQSCDQAHVSPPPPAHPTPPQAHTRNPYKARGKELKRLLPQGGSMWTYSPQAKEFRRDDDGALAGQLLLDHWKVGALMVWCRSAVQ